MAAPTVIDSLVIELGIDPSKFTAGEKEAMAAHKKTVDQLLAGGKEIESQGAKIDHYFGALKRGALGLLAGFVGYQGIKSLIFDVAGLDAAAGRAGKTMNMSAGEVTAWQSAMKQAGGSAESATGSLQGLSGAVNTFLITGQGPFLGVMNAMDISLFDVNKKLKTSNELLLEMAEKVHGMDPARASALLSLVPGMNQDTINLLIKGRHAVEEYLAAARRAGVATRESSEAAQDFNRNLQLLQDRTTNLGRSIFNSLIPALFGLWDAFVKVTTKAPEIASDSYLGAIGRWMIKDKSSLRDLWNDLKEVNRSKEVAVAKQTFARRAETEGMTNYGAKSGAFSSNAEKEAFIRTEASKRGIDPDQAVRVAKSEGFFTYNGDKDATGAPTSFGAFQLHYPGVGRNTADGLGSKFTRQTGLNARDPATEREQIKFALDEAKKGGWGPWHGWKGAPYAGIGAGGAAEAAASNYRGGDVSTNSRSSSVHIGTVSINAPKAENADQIAAEIPDALSRANWGSSANYGQQ